MTIDNLEGVNGSSIVTWLADGKCVEKQFSGTAKGILLRDHSAVLLIEPTGFPNNAVIYEADGSERTRIINPLASRGAICFTDAGYERDDLTLILRLAGTEFAYIIDELGNARMLKEIR